MENSPIPTINLSAIPSPLASPSSSPVPTNILSPMPSATATPVPTISAATTPWGSSFNPCPVNTQFIKLCNLQVGQIGQYISTIVAILLVVAIILSLFFLLFGGIRWIISAGDKAKADAARNAVFSSVIGLIVVFLAYFILSVVLGFFGISLSQLQLPRLPGK